MSNITNFKGQFAGGARPNLFQAEITFPAAVTGAGSAQGLSRFMIKAAQLPASIIAPIEVPYRGRKLKVAGDRTFEPWTVTVINDVGMEIRNAFESWMDLINRNVSNTTGLPGLNYYRDLQIYQLNRDFTATSTKSYNFVDAFPTNISAIDLNYETNDAVEEFTVEFNYQYWTSGQSTSTNQ